MNSIDLRKEILELLTELRKAGRQLAQSTAGSILDARLPGLVAASDDFANSILSEESLARMETAVAQVCASMAETNGDASRSPAFSRSRRIVDYLLGRVAWSAGIALMAAILLVGLWATGQFDPRKPGIAGPQPPKSTPSVTGPVPKPERIVPDERGPVVQGQPEVEIRTLRGPRDQGSEGAVAQRQPSAGKFGSVSGEPMVFAPNDPQGRAARPGMAVAYGSRIETGDFSRAELQFEDGTVLRLDFNTILKLPNTMVSKSRPREVDLDAGKLYASVAHVSDKDRFQVHTPVATAEVLGTVFGIELQKPSSPKGDLQARIQVREGQVRFSNEFGIVTLGSEFESTATRGAAPTEPQRIRTLRWQYLFTKDDDTAKTFSVVSSVTKPLDFLEAAYASDGDFGWNGIVVEEDAKQVRLRVSEVVPNSPGDRAGFMPGDIVLVVNGEALRSKLEFDRFILRNPHKTLMIQVERDGSKREFSVGNDHTGGSNYPVDPKIESRLWQLTWLGLDGRRAEAKKLLETEAGRLKSGSFFSNLGVLHEMDDELGRAIRAYQEAVRISPEQPRYRLNLALALQKIANHERAAEEMAQHVKLAGWYEFGAEQLAKAQAMAGNEELAVETLRTALEKLPNNAILWMNLSDGLRGLGKIEESAKAAQKAADLRPMLDRAWIKLGEVLSQLGRYAESENAFGRALEIHQDSILALHGIGLIKLRQGKFGEAEELGKRSVQIAPNMTLTRSFLGNAYRVQGKLTLAQAEYEVAVRLDPDDPVSHFNFALVCDLLNEHERAERHYKTAIRLAPGLWNAYSGFGRMLTELNRYDEADRMLREAIRLFPDSSALHNSLGWNLKKKGNFVEAEPEYRRAIELDPRNSQAYMNLGVLVGTLLGRLNEAEAVYREFLKNLPNNPYASNGLAYNLAERGVKLDEALTLSRRAVQLAPNDPDIVDTLGYILLLRGELGEVEAILRRAIELYGKSSSAAEGWVHLGMYFEKVNDRAQALDAYRNALQANPDEQRARAAVKRIGG